MEKILLTGATGFIGRRFNDRLLERADLDIRLLVRNRKKLSSSVLNRVEVVEGDTFNREALARALEGIDTAFYLIHGMGGGKDFAGRDRISAGNFRDAAIEAGVRRLVYLGGLGKKETASRHLASRIETGEILSAEPGRLQTVWFRAGIIVGPGSASFEIIQNLVQKLPLMITPKWVKNRTQPIAVGDVLSYLTAAIDLEARETLMVDIGAPPMSFREMMKETAGIMGLKRILIPVPVLSPRLSSYWLILFTPVPYQVASALVEGLRSETLVENDNAGRYFPEIKPMGFAEAVKSALAEIEEKGVVSRWCDSGAGAVCDIKDQEDTGSAILRDRREFFLNGLEGRDVFRVLTSLGGGTGWFAFDLLWRLRGMIDKFFGGYGLNRGRRDTRELRPGDALDFWKVVDLKEDRRLLLLAQMRLPGKAWLEFEIREDRLVQTAHFFPRGLAGRMYWFLMLPFHHLIFGRLGKKILEQALVEGRNRRA
ncbi:MAG: SDR family oxidoreductase [Desulfurivibrionaceae bacterium]